MWLWFLYYIRIVVIIEVVVYYVDIDWVRCIIIPLFWINIVYMHWHEIEYKLGTCRSSVQGMVRCKDYNLGTWRSSVQKLFDILIVRWDHPHRHVEIVLVGIWTSRVPHGSWTLDVFSRNIMYIWLRQYLESESYHFMVLHFIASHYILHFFPLIMDFIGC